MARQTFINKFDGWCNVIDIWVKVSGEWINDYISFRKISGTWKQCAEHWPTAPVATTATSVEASEFHANHDASARADGYYMDVSLYDDFNTMLIDNQDIGESLSEVVSASPSTTYYYRFRAYNNVNGDISGDSNTIEVHTPVA